MKTCPSCRRPVPNDASACPHPGCGKPLSFGAADKAPAHRPPPPPRKIQLAAADLSHVDRHVAAPGKRRGLLALIVGIAALFGGAAYFAFHNRDATDPLAARPGAPTERAPLKGALKPSPGDSKKQPLGSDTPPAAKSVQPELTATRGAEGTTNPSEASQLPAEPEALGLYSQRTAPRREEWFTKSGGTLQSEAAVAAGLEWLARHQADDGHWGPDCLGNAPGSKCEPGHACSGAGQSYEAALTGMAVLAFQAAGHYEFNHHAYSERVARALHCLAVQQGYNGELVGSLNQVSEGPEQQGRFDRCYMYEQSIATFALAEACALAKASHRRPDPIIWQAAVKGVRFIESQQHNDGGWRYSGDKKHPSDASVSGWAMLALKTAREAEIEISPETMPRLVTFFDKKEEPLTGRTHYVGSVFGTDALSGVGMMADQFVKGDLNSKRIRLAAAYLAEQAEANWGAKADASGPDYYLWYNCTLAMFQTGGEPWKRWNDATRDRVIRLQEGGAGCTRGSWPPDDRWSSSGGRIYSTAMAVLTLEVYYRFAKETLAGETPAKMLSGESLPSGK